MEELVIQRAVDYGAPELKRIYKQYLTRALALAIVFHFAGVGSYWATQYLTREEEPRATVRILKYSDLGPPPSMTSSTAAPAIQVPTAAVKPSVGIPVPVPDAEVNPEQTIATQQELSQAVGPVGEGATSGNVEIKIEEEPAEFVPVEKYPEPIKIVQPKYPEIAMRAGLEGSVFVKAWVTKEGKVKKALILKSDAEIFNQPALDAAYQFVFTPAIMNKGPVDVWTTIPFRFKLLGK